MVTTTRVILSGGGTSGDFMGSFERLNRQRTAVHEAAHAVILRVLSLPLDRVTIDVGANGSGGLCHLGPSADHNLLAMDKDTLTKKALTVLAGPLGQEILAEQELRQHPAITPGHAQVLDISFHDGNRSDYEFAEAIAVALIPHVDLGDQIGFDPAKATKMLAKLERKTKRLIERHRSAIGRLATELLARGALSGAEVDQIIGLPARHVAP